MSSLFQDSATSSSLSSPEDHTASVSVPGYRWVNTGVEAEDMGEVEAEPVAEEEVEAVAEAEVEAVAEAELQ